MTIREATKGDWDNAGATLMNAVNSFWSNAAAWWEHDYLNTPSDTDKRNNNERS